MPKFLFEATYTAEGARARDVIAIVDLPSAEAAAAISFAGMASGLSRVRTTPLLTVEEVDRALTRKLVLS